ncbi:type I DNA topoisomerase [Candidatus Beckwithbacteria bacterium]|nr:type I DNA topoisomerase [Candidatus Beckwithbacteria bacterium]
MNLIIVESPTKAKTLGRYLGNEYIVKATTGHIRDLPKSTLGVDVEHNFKPEYVIVEKKEKVIKELTQASKKAKTIIIATDPDREGEAIGFHIQWILEQNLKGKKVDFVRATFHEITKEAILNAINNPGKMNLKLVHAQEARRVLDRLVGYKLSPVLWKKIRRGLSAGRVQSVAVRLIVEREKEIEAFKPVEYWEIGAQVCKVKKPKSQFRIDLVKIDDKKAEVKNGSQAQKIVKDLEKAQYEIAEIAKRETFQNPMPPFITSTMQRAAANLFGWSSKKTMREAQVLYEHGYITYHRTDSVHLSSQALAMAASYITKHFDTDYLPETPRQFKTTSKMAQEAHEAIRPSNLNLALDEVEANAQKSGAKLYQLIFSRFLASQMAAARIAKTTVSVKAANYLLQAKGEIQLFAGWRKVYGKEIEDVQLPELEQGEILDLLQVLSEQKFTQPPARYSESSLIKALEQRGIGRPSTYAPTISTILTRNYIEKIEKQFYPTQIGTVVTEFLLKNFDKVMDYDFTAKVEQDLDDIALGEQKWTEVVGSFYNPFVDKVKSVEKNAERVKIEAEKTGNKCPECGEGDEVIRVGRFGRFLSCSRFPECKYTKNYTEKINMKCPDCKNGDVIVRRTRSGRHFYGCSAYPNCKWASWKKPKTGGSD